MALRDNAIIGFAETKTEARGNRHVWEIGGEILESLMSYAEVDKDEIDGMLVSASISGAGNCFWSQTTAEFLGLELDFCQTVDIGGSSAVGAVARAAAALDAGLCNMILLLNIDAQASDHSGLSMRSFHDEWQIPQGMLGGPADFGLLSRRYNHLYGLNLEALGKLAVTQRNHAILNDNACEKLRKPITVEDYLTSRMIADPIRLLDCVLTCDGGNGLLMTTRKRAREKGLHRTVIPLGYGERTNFRASDNLADITESGHCIAGERAFSQAQLTTHDMGSYQPYDDFLIAVLIKLEMLGFAKAGEGADFIMDHDISHLGDLPINTGGGQISAGQPGLAGGGVNLIEGVRQVFGEGGSRQVKNHRYSLVTGIGGLRYIRNWNSSTALILAAGG